MDESILITVRIACNIDSECSDFDSKIIPEINSTFFKLKQLGVGPKEGYYINSASNTWDEFLPEGILQEAAKDYVGLKVQSVFDPSASGTISQAIQAQLSELEWRLLSEVDY